MKLLEEKSNNSDSLFEDININSMSIKEISNLSPPKKKEKRNSNLDFLLGL